MLPDHADTGIDRSIRRIAPQSRESQSRLRIIRHHKAHVLPLVADENTRRSVVLVANSLGAFYEIQNRFDSEGK